jgi:AraC family transcriptional regulator
VRRGDRGALLAADAMIEAILVSVLRPRAIAAVSDGPRPPRDPAIAAAVRFIDAAYAEPLTVESIAKSARMSRFHFSRRFRDATGRSPYRYLQDVRLGRAAELLRRGRHGVTEAALSVGFTDPSRFARAFRAKFGASPAHYAKAR